MVKRAAGLSERESAVLRALVEAHVEIGAPIGSEWLARREGWALSSATIRTVLAGLEEGGYLRQPHTSAGRVPTEKGYRAYVAHRLRDGGFADAADLTEQLPEEMEALLSEGDCEEILGQLAQVIGQVTHQLGLVLAPRFEAGVFHRLELVRLAEGRLLLVVTVQRGLVRSLVLEVDATVSTDELDGLARGLNERLHGLTMAEIRRSGRERLAAMRGNPQLVRAVTEEIAVLAGPGETELYVAGSGYLCLQPEFHDPAVVADLAQLLESREALASLLRDRRGVVITVGLDNVPPAVRHCSMVTASYEVAGGLGVIGVIGPMRMPYGRVVNLVNLAACRAASLVG
jgi:heat-inducible transcriptional repressor